MRAGPFPRISFGSFTGAWPARTLSLHRCAYGPGPLGYWGVTREFQDLIFLNETAVYPESAEASSAERGFLFKGELLRSRCQFRFSQMIKLRDAPKY